MHLFILAVLFFLLPTFPGSAAEFLSEADETASVSTVPSGLDIGIGTDDAAATDVNAAADAETITQKPDFCGDYDCPKFDVIKTGIGFEVRKYAKAYWVSANITKEGARAENYHKALTEGFAMLFHYIQGFNLNDTKIDMTAPVHVTTFQHFGEHKDQTLFIVSFFVPLSQQERPIEPCDKRLYINEIDEVTVAVRHFDGFAIHWRKQVEPEFEELARDLTAAHESYESAPFMVAIYDPPTKIVDRHNEVWLALKKKKKKDIRNSRRYMQLPAEAPAIAKRLYKMGL